jgi:hypothetical protein
LEDSSKRDRDDGKTRWSGKGRDFRGGKGKKPFKKKARRVLGKVRRTATEPSGIKDVKTNSQSTVSISMKDDEDDDEPNSGDGNNDDSDESGQDEHSVEE